MWWALVYIYYKFCYCVHSVFFYYSGDYYIHETIDYCHQGKYEILQYAHTTKRLIAMKIVALRRSKNKISRQIKNTLEYKHKRILLKYCEKYDIAIIKHKVIYRLLNTVIHTNNIYQLHADIKKLLVKKTTLTRKMIVTLHLMKYLSAFLCFIPILIVTPSHTVSINRGYYENLAFILLCLLMALPFQLILNKKISTLIPSKSFL